MDLILWRHADAAFTWPDEHRALTPLGLEQAQCMADWLNPLLPSDTRILVSPARRTQQTAQALKRDFHTEDNLAPRKTAHDVLNAAHWPHGTETTLIVGHQPILGEIVSLLLTGSLSEWPVHKASIWWFKQTQGEKPTLAAMMTPEILSHVKNS
jgi:phosphohistidine phosphatase